MWIKRNNFCYRYWSKEERKRHLEKAKDYKRRKETMMKQRMDTLKEGEEKGKDNNIVHLSHRKMNKHKNKKVLDNFVTVQEMLAHGSRTNPEGKTYNPLLSVTTVWYETNQDDNKDKNDTNNIDKGK